MAIQKKACAGLWFFYDDSIKKQVEEAQKENNDECESCKIKIDKKTSSNKFNLKQYRKS